jgi:HK97 family phage major capsid protein/HK97 family phage prohead protease
MADAKRTRAMSFSSEDAVVDRWFGGEILDHSTGSVRMGFFNSGRAPLLLDHDMRKVVGVIERASIGRDGILRGEPRFSRNPDAEAVLQDVDDGIRTNTSVGYRIFEMRLESTGERGDVYRVTDWEPFEGSLVGVPADSSVGVGRAAPVSPPTPAEPAVSKEQTRMSDDNQGSAAPSAANPPAAAAQAATSSAVETASRAVEKQTALQMEQERVNGITKLAKANSISDNIRDTWIRQGYNFDQVGTDLLQILEERGKHNPSPAAKLGLGREETQRFSMTRAILATVTDDWSKAGFELECSKAVAQKRGIVADPRKFYVPFEVLQRPIPGGGRRDLTVATAGAGGYLVETENQGFIEILRNRSVCFRMGARRLSGLVGSVTIPRQSVAGTAYWLANEATDITESQQTFVQVALSPKNVGAYTEISRQLLLQSSPAAEGIVNDDLAQVVAIAADLAGLEGSGSAGQPTGISATSGIGSVSGTTLAAAGVLEFQSDVAANNVIPAMGGYVTTPAVAAGLMVKPELPSTGTERLWKGSLYDGSLFDQRAMTSNQLTAASMIYGDWQELVIAEWGSLEVEVNPYANFKAGIVGVRAIYSLDVGVRRPFAFSRATSIT